MPRHKKVVDIEKGNAWYGQVLAMLLSVQLVVVLTRIVVFAIVQVLVHPSRLC